MKDARSFFFKFLLIILLVSFVLPAVVSALSLSVTQEGDRLKITTDEPAFFIIRINNGIPVYANGTEVYFKPYISGKVTVEAITDNESVAKEIEFRVQTGQSSGGGVAPAISYWWSGVVRLPPGYFKKESESGKEYKIEWRTALGALEMAARKGGFNYKIKSTDWGPFVKCIAGKCEKSEGAFSGWMYQVNGKIPSVGAHEYVVREYDEVLWYFVKNMDGTPETSSKVLRIFVLYNNTVLEENHPNQTANQTMNQSISPSVNQSVSQANQSSVFPLSIDDPRIINALRYLKTLQHENGGFSNPGEEVTLAKTTWAVMTLVAAKQNPEWWKKDDSSAIDYVKKELKRQMKYMGTADFARTILALYAAGKNPRDFEGVDLVGILKSKVKENGQIGDFTYTTIWGLMALKVSGEDVSKTVEWLINQQNEDGGFGWAPGQPSDYDDTAAAIQALVAANVSCDTEVIKKAFDYLKTGQNKDGGFRYFGNSSSNAASDSWVIQAIVACNGNPLQWKKNVSVVEHLLSLQQPDGSFNYTAYQKSNPGYMTASAIMALLGKPFPIRPMGKYVSLNASINLNETQEYRNVSGETELTVTPTATPKLTVTPTATPTPTPELQPTETPVTSPTPVEIPKTTPKSIPGFGILLGAVAMTIALSRRMK